MQRRRNSSAGSSSLTCPSSTPAWNGPRAILRRLIRESKCVLCLDLPEPAKTAPRNHDCLDAMTQSSKNSKVDFYFTKAKQWKEEFEKLRTIVLGCGLTEEVRWGCPCYTFEKRNVVLIHGFKEYCALLFFKGVLLKDPNGILIQQTKNVQSARQIRFANVREIVTMETILQAYIHQAMEVERGGLQVN